MTDSRRDWLQVTTPNERGVSFVRLRDIERIYYGPRGRDTDAGYVVAISLNNVQYVYQTVPTEVEAMAVIDDLMARAART